MDNENLEDIAGWPPSSPQDIDSLIRAHETVRNSGLINARGCRIPVPSKLNMPNWYDLLQDYSDSELCDHLKYGFPINYTRDAPPSVPPRNHPSAFRFSDSVDKYVLKEVTHGATLGPFTHNPLCSALVTSPLQTVEKKDSVTRRTVMDLSYPPDSSVNSGIPKGEYLGESLQLKYPTIDNLVSLVVQLGPGCKLFKCDLSRAYRQLYIDPGDYHYMGFRWRQKLFIDIAFPFGIRSAAFNCQRTTDAVRFLYKKLYNRDLVNYLDDFGSAQLADEAEEAYQQLIHLIQDILGLDLGLDKCVSPATVMVFLGILLNTVLMEMSIPTEKINAALQELRKCLSYTCMTKRAIQSLLGKLLHIASCVRPGRIFVSRLIEMTKGDRFPVHLDSEFFLDIQWWIRFLRVYNGVSLIQDGSWSDIDAILSTDACLTGAGGFFQGRYFHRQFPDWILSKKLDINSLIPFIIVDNTCTLAVFVCIHALLHECI